jgi:hypothetical protein
MMAGTATAVWLETAAEDAKAGEDVAPVDATGAEDSGGVDATAGEEAEREAGEEAERETDEEDGEEAEEEAEGDGTVGGREFGMGVVPVPAGRLTRPASVTPLVPMRNAPAPLNGVAGGGFGPGAPGFGVVTGTCWERGMTARFCGDQ